MKKTYLTPETKEIKVKIETVILAGSDPEVSTDPVDPNDEDFEF